MVSVRTSSTSTRSTQKRARLIATVLLLIAVGCCLMVIQQNRLSLEEQQLVAQRMKAIQKIQVAFVGSTVHSGQVDASDSKQDILAISPGNANMDHRPQERQSPKTEESNTDPIITQSQNPNTKADELISVGRAAGIKERDLMLDSKQTNENHKRIETKRQRFRDLCEANSSTEELTQYLYDFFEPGLPDGPDVKSERRKLHLDNIAENFTYPCQFTFLDFGANVGDSLTKLINIDLPKCPGKKIKTSRIEYRDKRFDMRVVPFNKRLKIFNVLMKWIGGKELVAFERKSSVGRRIRPEEFCYFGIEGNPVFSSRLELMEQKAMRASPRPVRYAHFFTETVGTATDGKTTLYLDTSNKKANFWGSSLDPSHPDVQASLQKDGKLTEASVNGISLPSLVQKTTIKQSGSLVLIKMDIEGAEKQLLASASQSSILLDYAQSGVEIAMLVERHGSEAEYANIVDSFAKMGIRVNARVDAG